MNATQLRHLTLNTFPNVKYLYWLCVETPIYIISKGSYRDIVNFHVEDFIIFEFIDRKIIWLNNELETKGGRSATVIVPDIKGKFDGDLIGKRFLSYLARKDESQYIELPTRSPQKNGETICVQPIYKSGGATRHKDYLTMGIDPGAFSDKYWIALAYHREAVNSYSPYYKFLSYWKIIELAFDNNTNNINNFISQYSKKSPSAFWKIRNKAAHIMNKDKKNQYEDPDNPMIYKNVQLNIAAIINLASILIKDPTKFS